MLFPVHLRIVPAVMAFLLFALLANSAAIHHEAADASEDALGTTAGPTHIDGKAFSIKIDIPAIRSDASATHENALGFTNITGFDLDADASAKCKISSDIGPNERGPFYSGDTTYTGRYCATNKVEKVSVCARLDWYYLEPLKGSNVWKLTIGLKNYGSSSCYTGVFDYGSRESISGPARTSAGESCVDTSVLMHSDPAYFSGVLQVWCA